MTTIDLPTAEGGVEAFAVPDEMPWEPTGVHLNRVVYAAAHVVARRDAATEVDWEVTLQFREYLWDCGLGVAEAMDTAQRSMGLSWPQARELISRTLAAAKARETARVVCGCGTDHLDLATATTLEAVVAAYEMQMDVVELHGGRLVLMASRALCAVAQSAQDYQSVYGRLLSLARHPVVIHWLGPMFDPRLAGYWGSHD